MILSFPAEPDQVYLQQNKKKAEAEDKNCHATIMLSLKADKAYMKDNPHVPLRQIDEE